MGMHRSVAEAMELMEMLRDGGSRGLREEMQRSRLRWGGFVYLVVKRLKYLQPSLILRSVHVLRFRSVASATFLSISIVLLRSLYNSPIYNTIQNEDLVLRIMGHRP
jgi:hypothetical protein